MKHIKILTKRGLLRTGRGTEQDIYGYCEEGSWDTCTASDQGSCTGASYDDCGYDAEGCSDNSADYCGGYDYGGCSTYTTDYCSANDYQACLGNGLGTSGADTCPAGQGGNDYCDSPPAPDYLIITGV